MKNHFHLLVKIKAADAINLQGFQNLEDLEKRINPTKLHRKAVIGWFDDKANFKTMHNQKVDVFEMEKWLEF